MTTVTLSSPIQHGETALSELTFREAEVGDLMLADSFNTDFSKTIVILASISDTPLPVFRKVKARDLKTIMAQTKHLLGNEPLGTTGE